MSVVLSRFFHNQASAPFLGLTAGCAAAITQQHEARTNHGVGICPLAQKRFAKFIVEGFFPAGDDAGQSQARALNTIFSAAEASGMLAESPSVKDRTYGGRTVESAFHAGVVVTLGCSADTNFPRGCPMGKWARFSLPRLLGKHRITDRLKSCCAVRRPH